LGEGLPSAPDLGQDLAGDRVPDERFRVLVAGVAVRSRKAPERGLVACGAAERKATR
jgi:hypothetical protein